MIRDKTPESANLVELASWLAQASRNWPDVWPAGALEQWQKINKGAVHKALGHFGRKSLPESTWGQARDGLIKLFMLGVGGHALESKAVDLGFDPTETQLNKAIGKFLNTKELTNVVRHRVRSFLAALYENRPQKQEMLSSFNESATIVVDAERSFETQGTRRKMDLVIGWPSLESGQCQHMVVVEIKFEHRVTIGQLSAYRGHAKQIKANMDCIGLFLLTFEGKQPPPPNKNWIGISWMMLLRNWEQYLAAGSEPDTDHDFIRLRRMLWQRIH